MGICTTTICTTGHLYNGRLCNGLLKTIYLYNWTTVQTKNGPTCNYGTRNRTLFPISWYQHIIADINNSNCWYQEIAGIVEIKNYLLISTIQRISRHQEMIVDATERTRFSRSRPNDLEDIGQGQRSLYATHPLMLVIICAKYGKIPLRIVDFFFKVKAEKFQKFAKIWNFQILKKT